MNPSGNSEFLPVERVHDAWPILDQPAQRTMTMGQVVALCWRRRIPALIAGSLVTLLVIVVTLRITPLYEARAQLEIASSAKVLDFQGGGEAPRIDYTLVNTVKARLLATPALERVLASSPLEEGPAYVPGQGNPVATLRDRLRVTTNRDSWMIQVSLRDEDAQRAKQGLAALIASYYELMRERDATRSSSTVDFLRSQVIGSTTLYEQAFAAEEAFRAANGITSADPEDNPFGRRLLELDRARINLAAQGSALTAVAQQIAKAEAQPEDSRLERLLSIDTIARHPAVGEQRQLLAKAQAELGMLKRQYGAKHPQLQQAAEEVAVRQRQLADAAKAAGSSVLASREEIEVQQNILEQRIATVEAELADYRADLSRMQALSQETGARGRLLDELRRRLAEQEVASRIESTQVAIASPPEVAARPANRHSSLFVAAGLFLGLCSAVAAAFAAEHFDRKIRGPAALRATSAAPLLATIPAVAGGLPRLAQAHDPSQPSELAESFAALRMSLRLSPQYREASTADLGCCLAVTSSGLREGCSTVVSRLAISLAATGSKVLLIDADLHTPSLHEQFREASQDGFSQLLAGEQQHAMPTRYPRLDLMCAGPRPAHPADLLHSPVLAWYINEARRRYDWILFNTPPVGHYSDALIIGEHADGVILVVRDGVALRDAVADSARKLRSLGDKLVGTVLTAARDSNVAGTVEAASARDGFFPARRPPEHALTGGRS